MRIFNIFNIRKWIILILVCGIFVHIGFLVMRMNDRIFPQVEELAKVEASNAATQVIKRAVSTIEVNPSECMKLNRDAQGNIVEINYNTYLLNQILSDCLTVTQQSLDAASSGLMDPNTKMIYYDKGIIYSVHLGYFTGIALFSQFGPPIDIHMKVMNACSGEIEVSSTAYGLNCTLIEIDLVITTQMLVVTPFLMTQAPIECRIPLVIQMVQGKLPDMILD